MKFRWTNPVIREGPRKLGPDPRWGWVEFKKKRVKYRYGYPPASHDAEADECPNCGAPNERSGFKGEHSYSNMRATWFDRSVIERIEQWRKETDKSWALLKIDGGHALDHWSYYHCGGCRFCDAPILVIGQGKRRERCFYIPTEYPEKWDGVPDPYEMMDRPVFVLYTIKDGEFVYEPYEIENMRVLEGQVWQNVHSNSVYLLTKPIIDHFWEPGVYRVGESIPLDIGVWRIPEGVKPGKHWWHVEQYMLEHWARIDDQPDFHQRVLTQYAKAGQYNIEECKLVLEQFNIPIPVEVKLEKVRVEDRKERLKNWKPKDVPDEQLSMF